MGTYILVQYLPLIRIVLKIIRFCLEGKSHTSTHSSRKKLIANPTGKTQYGMSDLSPINSPLLFFELGIARNKEWSVV